MKNPTAGPKKEWKELVKGHPRSAIRKNKGNFKRDTENMDVNINMKTSVQSTGR